MSYLCEKKRQASLSSHPSFPSASTYKHALSGIFMVSSVTQVLRTGLREVLQKEEMLCTMDSLFPVALETNRWFLGVGNA